VCTETARERERKKNTQTQEGEPGGKKKLPHAISLKQKYTFYYYG
jgi:hypothetical protein